MYIQGRKLNSIKPEGGKGFLHWRDWAYPFIEWYRRRNLKKAINTVTKNSTIPYDKALVVYTPQIRIKPVEVPIPLPQISLRTFITLFGILIIVSIAFLSFAVYIYLRDDYDYRERIRHEIIYNMERYLEPYAARQKELETKIDTLNEILPLDSEFRRRLIQKYTGYDVKVK